MRKYFFLLSLAFACQSPKEKVIEDIPAMAFEEIVFPGINAAEPNLTVGSDGAIYLSWIEKKDNISSLNYASLENNKWSKVSQIASGDNWFVNWADFPALLVMESAFAAHYLAYITEDKYSYGVNLVSSTDGDTWSDPMLAHDDGTPTEHGFVTLLPMSNETFMAIWLDGRKYAAADGIEPSKEMSLRSGIFDLEGNTIEEAVIDPRTCDCCQTDGVITDKGPVIVYRDRGLMEIRDIYISRYENGNWLEPWVVSADNWEIPGCPVNGPAIDADKEHLSVAWFTAANGTSKVLVSTSENTGDDFNEPIRVDLGNPLGRVDLKQFADYSIVTWMEEKDETAFIYCRKVFNDGRIEEPVIIDETSSARASGFPRIAKDGSDLIFAWTVAGDKSSIKTKRGVFNH